MFNTILIIFFLILTIILGEMVIKHDTHLFGVPCFFIVTSVGENGLRGVSNGFTDIKEDGVSGKLLLGFVGSSPS